MGATGNTTDTSGHEQHAGGTTRTARLVHDVDMPTLEVFDIDAGQQTRDELRELAADGWIVRGALGYLIIRYDDVTAMLRDKRWHNAVAKLPEMMGITDPDFVGNDRVSILAAEGEMHTRLRRLVAKAFSPRSADRLRPFMREVVDDLIDRV